MPTGREKHKITNPLNIGVLPKRIGPEASASAPRCNYNKPKDPFKKTRNGRPGTVAAFSQLHDGFNNAGKQLAEQRPLPFPEMLRMLLPPKLATAKTSSDPLAIMEKLKKIGKTSWFVFKHVLKIVQNASGSCPQLQAALKALCLVLDQLDMMSDAQSNFFEVSSKLSALQFILFRNRDSQDERAQERLTSFAQWANSVRVYIEMHTKQNAAVRFFVAGDSRKTTIQLLKSLESVINFFMLDITLHVGNQVKRLQMNVDEIEDHLQLKELNHVVQASWVAQKEDKCLTGTRCIVMSDLMNWCMDPKQPRVFWLSGMAGTGKSAIARTLCDKLNSAHLLGGSFFCSRRGSAEQRDIARVIPTLARHLARLDSQYRQNVTERLKRDSDISNATTDKQLEELLIKPCSEVLRALLTPMIFVIDGLDEGADVDDTAQLLETILSRADRTPFRFFLTSRPECHIREKFARPTSSKRTQILRLHDIEETMVKADIQLYVQYRLDKIKEESNLELPKEWPAIDQIQKLADRADKLFIYAFTACNYIKRDPVKRLNIIIRKTTNDERPLMQRLDDMYTVILDEAKNPETADPGIVSDIQKCLTALVCVQETLSVIGLATLMETEPRQIRIVMNDLHSLILVPEINDDGPVTILHTSLGDYLNDEQRSKQHAITKDTANWILLRRCLQVLSQELRFNISGSTTSFLTNDRQRLKLPYILVYSAANWARHMMEISPSEELLTTIIAWVKSTLIPKFLFWLEVMSVGEKINEVPGMLWELLRFIEDQAEPGITGFLHDALLFVNASRGAIRRSAPHIYLSALALCQQESRVKKEFEHEYGGIPLAYWNGVQRSQLIFCIAVHASTVCSVAFSPDGKYIVSGSGDKTVRVWDAQTGRSTMKPFQGHNAWVQSATFSPDGKYIISCSDDTSVRIWDAKTGRSTMKPIQGHTDYIRSVSCSPDGKYIVSGSVDSTLRIWDSQTGRPKMKALQGHTDYVLSVSFSPDGRYIVSGSRDNTVRVWNAQTGRPTVKPFQGHTDYVQSVAFSPNGMYIASGSSDKTVRIWDAQMGRLMMNPFHGHTSRVRSVAFSPDGKYIVSGSDDWTVRVWDAQTGKAITKPLKGHTNSVLSVAFSPDGRYIVSGSVDKTVRVWDAQTPREEAPYTSQSPPISPCRDVAIQHTVSFSTVSVDSASTSPASIGSVSFSPHVCHGFPLDNDLFTLPSTNAAGDLRDIFTIYPQNSGWILGPNNELFLWIPADIRSSLWLPQATGPASEDKLYLDLSEYSCGPHWMDCRRSLDRALVDLGTIDVTHIEDRATPLDNVAVTTHSSESAIGPSIAGQGADVLA